VTQPTLSNGLALLEEELGGPIFVRTTRKVALSPFGEHILPLIEAVLRAQAELEAGGRAFYHPAHRMVRIGLSPPVDSRVLGQVLEPYEAEHRGVETHFKECFLDELDERLRSAQLDVVIRPRPVDAPPRKSVAGLTIYEEDLFYVPRHAGTAPALQGDAVHLQD